MTASSLRGVRTEKEFRLLAVKLFNSSPNTDGVLEVILNEAARNRKVTGKTIGVINKTIVGYKILKGRGLGSEAAKYVEGALIKDKHCPIKFAEQLSSR